MVSRVYDRLYGGRWIKGYMDVVKSKKISGPAKERDKNFVSLSSISSFR